LPGRPPRTQQRFGPRHLFTQDIEPVLTPTENGASIAD
jgi:hypothetical protein